MCFNTLFSYEDQCVFSNSTVLIDKHLIFRAETLCTTQNCIVCSVFIAGVCFKNFHSGSSRTVKIWEFYVRLILQRFFRLITVPNFSPIFLCGARGA